MQRNSPFRILYPLNATARVVPLSKTMKEQVEHIRNWAFDRAVRASPRDAAR